MIDSAVEVKIKSANFLSFKARGGKDLQLVDYI